MTDDTGDLGAGRAATVDQAIDALMPEAIDLLQRMVRVNSINPLFPGIRREDVIGGETVAGAMLADWVAGAGLTREIVAPDPERANTVMIGRGAGGGRSMLINGHVDTVAPFRIPEWREGNPWSGTVEDGRLYGLGSTDMKSGLVSAALAARALEAAGIRLKGDLQIHAVVGEEVMSHELGTTAVLEAGYVAEAGIVVEPTNEPEPLSIDVVSSGNFNLYIDVQGHGTHVGNRGLSIRAGGLGNAAGVNAVEKAILVVQALQQLEQEWGISKRHPAFPAGTFGLVPSVFHGDVGVPSVGYLAEAASVGYLVWYPPNETPEAIMAEIEGHVAHAAAMDSWLRHNPPRFRWNSCWPVYETADDHPLVQRMIADRANVLGPTPAGLRRTHAFTAVCDSSFIHAKGIPVVTFGPGDLRRAHAVDESVALSEVRDAARVLARTIAGWCEVA